tara:strand:+ start:358 stop:525 length:168 start_codon:yes stop_codon:yes gene_type:complete
MNFIPEEFEINEPPIMHRKMKIIVPSKDVVKEIPELLILVITLIIISLKLLPLRV